MNWYYNRFLHEDGHCSPQLKDCFNRLEKDEATLLSLQMKKAKILDQGQEAFLEKARERVSALDSTECKRNFSNERRQLLFASIE